MNAACALSLEIHLDRPFFEHFWTVTVLIFGNYSTNTDKVLEVLEQE